MSHGAPTPIVVKIGGSLLRGSPPRDLIARLAACPHLVLVPGGGVLADAVRGVQPLWGLSDRAAHAMAILAMEQMAHAFIDLEPRLAPCRTPSDLAAPRAGAALWFPAGMLVGAPDIAESWDVTSDSLALWLAISLNAPRLVLVKAPGARVPAEPLAPGEDLSGLASTGLVDAAFPGLAPAFKGSIVLVNADDSTKLNEASQLDAREDRSKDRQG